MWSNETYRIFEYIRAEKPTREKVFERIHPEDEPLARQIVDGVHTNGKDFEHECRLLLPSGTVKRIHVRAHALRDSSGKIEFVGAVTDITERKLAEESLRRSEERFRLVLDSIGAYVIATTLEGELELSRKFAAQEKEMIEAALRESRGRVSGSSGAAAKLGIPGSTLESKIRSLKINKNHFRA